MARFKQVVSSIARFFAFSLLIDLGMFLIVSAFCLLRENCSGEMWSEYMFWLSMLALIAGMPAVLASLSSSRGYFDNPLTAGADMAVARTIIQHERKELSKRTMYTLRMFSIGIIGIAISAVIELLSHTNP